jgi:hypothetical protein
MYASTRAAMTARPNLFHMLRSDQNLMRLMMISPRTTDTAVQMASLTSTSYRFNHTIFSLSAEL